VGGLMGRWTVDCLLGCQDPAFSHRVLCGRRIADRPERFRSAAFVWGGNIAAAVRGRNGLGTLSFLLGAGYRELNSAVVLADGGNLPFDDGLCEGAASAGVQSLQFPLRRECARGDDRNSA